MGLLFLLLVPLIIDIIGYYLGKGRITLKEFAAQFGVVVILMTIGYFIGRWGATRDTEIWNGRVALKHEGWQGCCHSYPCNPYPCNCGENGCSTCWNTCYEHLHDKYWNATSTNNETIFSDTCNSPYSSPPARWLAIRLGEPTAYEHGYTNYIKAAPSSVLRHHGLVDRYKKYLPKYPEVYDWYRANRFLFVQTNPANVNQQALNEKLSELNADLGAAKEVHIMIIVVPTDDRGYLYGLEEAWLGGKQNDFVVVIGAPEFPKITWAEVMSWTKIEELKIAVRDRVENLGNFDGEKIIDILRHEISAKFVRRPMSDFKYLSASITPPFWAMVLLLIIGIAVSFLLQRYFWEEDPFDDRSDYNRRRR